MADMADMMQQMMQDPAMMQQLMKENSARKASARTSSPPNAAVEEPELRSMLEPVRAWKQTGTEKFQAKDAAGALVAYQAAIAAAGASSSGDALAWPQTEALVFVCRSNAALCLLSLGRPDEAIAETDLALAMPIANGSEVLPKVLARKLQGLIDASRERSAILGFADELRRRGVFDLGAAGQSKFIEQIARLSETEAGSAVGRAFDVLAAHWLATNLFDQATFDAAEAARGGDRPDAAEAARDRTALRELASLAGSIGSHPLIPELRHKPPRMSVKETIRFLYGSFSDCRNEAAPTAQATKVLRMALAGAMHPSFPGALDSEGGGYLMWGLSTAFEQSRRTAADVSNFLALLSILVDEFGADINQRATKGQRVPLMYVCLTGCVQAVQAMICRGASIHLRDEEGRMAALPMAMHR